MANSIEYVRQQCRGTVQAVGESLGGQAVVVTTDEVAVGVAGLFGRWGTRLDRRALSGLRDVEVKRNAGATLLRMHFRHGQAPLSVMYTAENEETFNKIIAALRARLS